MSVYSPVDAMPAHMAVAQIGLVDNDIGKNHAIELAIKADVKETLAALLPVLKRHESDYHEDAVIAAAKAMELNGKHDQALDTLRKGLTYHQDSPALQDELKRLETPSGKS